MDASTTELCRRIQMQYPNQLLYPACQQNRLAKRGLVLAPPVQDQRVHSGTVIKWVNDWGPLITLSSAVVLAGVTAWLAYLTMILARSARTAAADARVAAELVAGV